MGWFRCGKCGIQCGEHGYLSQHILLPKKKAADPIEIGTDDSQIHYRRQQQVTCNKLHANPKI